VHGRLPAGISVDVPDDGTRGRAEARFAAADAARAELIGAVPKAVSRHELRFARDGDLWRCHVTVDI
jgi:SHS2 domain-containing protein